MNSDMQPTEIQDEALMQRLRAMPEVKLDAHAQARMRLAVQDRIDQAQGFMGWLFKSLWRPVLAALLPFATGLAFGQSDYLEEARVLVEPEDPVELATSIDAAHSLLEIYSQDLKARDVD